jgi:hypothetical protein
MLVGSEANESFVKVGDVFVLCDAGGGTVDLISYKITQTSPTFLIEEAAVGSGDKCGASYVDKVRSTQARHYLLTTLEILTCCI